jgi:hypothetical protein
MDSSNALRIAVRVPAYYEAFDDGRNVGHNATDFQLIRDRDTLNLSDLTGDVKAKLFIGKNQGFNLCYFNKYTQGYANLTSDASLMNAIENYWELRRLPLFVNFYDLVPMAYSQSLSLDNETGTSTDPPLLPLLLGADGGTTVNVLILSCLVAVPWMLTLSVWNLNQSLNQILIQLTLISQLINPYLPKEGKEKPGKRLMMCHGKKMKRSMLESMMRVDT